MCSPEDVEYSAGCQAAKNCSSKPQDLDREHGERHYSGAVTADCASTLVHKHKCDHSMPIQKLVTTLEVIND